MQNKKGDPEAKGPTPADPQTAALPSTPTYSDDCGDCDDCGVDQQSSQSELCGGVGGDSDGRLLETRSLTTVGDLLADDSDDYSETVSDCSLTRSGDCWSTSPGSDSTPSPRPSWQRERSPTHCACHSESDLANRAWFKLDLPKTVDGRYYLIPNLGGRIAVHSERS